MQFVSLRRRDLITLLAGSAAAWLNEVGAQQPGELPIVGYLGPNVESVDRPRLAAFKQRLNELGWIEGRSVIIEYRPADGLIERASEIASEFVSLKVKVILTSGDAQGLAAKRATSGIPIVIAIVGDPVGDGLVTSLARPGGNVTGLSMVQPETAGKRLEMLREILPNLRQVGILGNVANAGAATELKVAQDAAHKLNLDTITLEIRRGEDIPAAIASLGGGAGALYVCVDPVVNSNRVRINALALDALLPVVHSFRDNVEAGGLISYGPDILVMYRRAADFVDKILRGTKPGDIPVEQPTKFELVINLRTAKVLGLTIPATLLARADAVIE
jgi:putative tryptophan/tyrosine transport system substrate-binding protein